MAPKIIAQILLCTTQIFGKAIMEAYKEAAKNAASQQARQTMSHHVKDTVSKSMGMTLDEAFSILHVPKQQVNSPQLQERYLHLFQQNDPMKGGSFYLQSKIYRAKERIDLWKQTELKKGASNMV
ncbi:mitochondrial import inner membrane translocase subunit TIM16 [Coelomomyces lativittatus]|nr:mitochondrial import inner membrane translocase subunit TIM16 [Coelomomyces lativittatus]